MKSGNFPVADRAGRGIFPQELHVRADWSGFGRNASIDAQLHGLGTAGTSVGVGDFVILSTRRRVHLGLAAAFMVLASSIATLLLVPRYSKPVAVADVGTLAPDFKLTDASGATFSLSDCRGHVVVLFFAPLQSAGSAEYNEDLKKIVRNYDTNGDTASQVKFAAVNIGNGTTPDAPLPHLANDASESGFLTLLDARATVASSYSATATPMVIVIDPRGVVCYRGPVDHRADNHPAAPSISQVGLADTLNDLLGQARVSVASK